MLNKRQEKIIVLLNNVNRWMTGKEIAGLTGVSDRTVRSDIERINSEYESPVIESSLRNGYRVNQAGMHSVPTDLSRMVPQTPEERCIYIIRELLFKKKELNLIELQDQVYISGYTIENDLKRIRRILEPYDDLKIERSKNKIYLSGSEGVKRRLYKDLLTEETKGNFLNLNNMINLYKDFDLLKVKQELDRILEKYKYHVRETAMPMLLMHIGVSVERMMHQNYVIRDKEYQGVKKSVEFKIAVEFYYALSQKIDILFTEEEAEQLAILLMGKKSEAYIQNTIMIHGQQFDIEDIVRDIIDDIYQTYDIDLRKDTDLETGLRNHIRSLIERKKQGVEAQNLYLPEVKKKYPLIFDMSVRAGRKLGTLIGCTIGEDEIGFLALHFGSAYEKSSSYDKYKVLLVCPGDGVLSSRCLQKIELRFSDRIEIVGQISMFEESVVRDMAPDLILTTLPLIHRLDIPTVQISLFVDADDENNIFFTLRNMDRARNREKFETVIKNLIRPEFFYTNVEVSSYEDMISMMAMDLEKAGYVSESFCNSVLQREQLSATSFELGFALPHAMNMEAFNSCLSIAILKDPIVWGGVNVKLVIMLAIRDVDHKMLGTFFDWMTTIVSDSAKFSKLLQVNTYDEFAKQVTGGQNG